MKGQINSFFANLSYFENRMTFFDFQIGFFRGSNNKAALFSVCIALSFCALSFSFFWRSAKRPFCLIIQKTSTSWFDIICWISVFLAVVKPPAFHCRIDKPKAVPTRRSEWGTILPPECFVVGRILHESIAHLAPPGEHLWIRIPWKRAMFTMFFKCTYVKF
uniref:Uncharacterized protein n=1 Tax=Cacopsylla melanoneura TaxID=428564 RepID=A0A8D8RQR9_9HEMI